MTQQQWDDHRLHIDQHISWPATKQQIVDACEGMDVDPEVLAEVRTKLPDGDRKYTKAELKKLLVTES